MKRLKELTLIELLVYAAAASIVLCTIVGAVQGIRGGKFSLMIGPDGKAIYTVTINGHEYLKTGDLLTHLASCPACAQKESK